MIPLDLVADWLFTIATFAVSHLLYLLGLVAIGVFLAMAVAVPR